MQVKPTKTSALYDAWTIRQVSSEHGAIEELIHEVVIPDTVLIAAALLKSLSTKPASMHAGR
jgi:hypothetical protein